MKVVLIILLFVHLASAQEIPDKSKRSSDFSLAKESGLSSYTILNINNLTTWSRSDGQSNHSPTGADGWIFPWSTGNVVYQDCIVWGGKVYLDSGFTQPAPFQPIRVGGGTYGVGTREGWINGMGADAVPADRALEAVRIYRIRRDYAMMSQRELIRDAATYFEVTESRVSPTMMNQILSWYERDWNEWPVERGAPYIERNGIPGYQKPPPFTDSFTPMELMSGGFDEPGMAGSDNQLPAHQVIWTVYNDLDPGQANSFVGSNPLGLEIQKTVWGYKYPPFLGNIYFTRYFILNKGGATVSGTERRAFYIDSMYVAQWSDPDIGDIADDLVGCDTTISLGFAYNANAIDARFSRFNLPPPSVGYVFLQGPLIQSPGDSAIFDLTVRSGFRNEALKSFSITFPTIGDPVPSTFAARWWKIIRGFAPSNFFYGPDFHNPYPSGSDPFYMFSGDPVTGSGWIDGQGTIVSPTPGDRRIVMGSGPFTMAPGDTQEIVIAGVAGIGSDRLSSITVMKSIAKMAREVYKGAFAVPRPPAPPKVYALELNRQIILEWGSDYDRVKLTEQTISGGDYAFEGYNIYQLQAPNQSISDAMKIETFDVRNGVRKILEHRFDTAVGQFVLVLIQQGTDSGVRRFINVTHDALASQSQDNRLKNGKAYYFAVTAYNYSPTAAAPSFESDPVIVRVVPKIPFGIEFAANHGDTLIVNHTSGESDGRVSALIVDPTMTTGDTYDIRFRDSSDIVVWDVINVSKGIMPIQGNSSRESDDIYPIVDGILVTPRTVTPDFKDFLVVADGNGPKNPPTYGAFRFNSSGFPHSSGFPPIAGDGFDRPAPNKGGARWGIHAGGIVNFTYPTFVNQVTDSGTLWQHIAGYDWELRFTSSGGSAFVPHLYSTGDSVGGTLISVPFELWRIGTTPNDPSDDVRLFPFIKDVRSNGVFDLSGEDHSISGGDNDPMTDWIYWILPDDDSPGQGGYDAMLAQIQSDPATYRYLSGAQTEVMKRMVVVNFNGGSVSDPAFPNNVNQHTPETGQVFRLITTKPNKQGDVFSYSAPSVKTGLHVQKASARRVGVFPNPYYGSHKHETTTWRRFVTFNNLPESVIIRIFNLAGHLVRTLRKENSSQFLEWDLTNEDYWQVASGIYICHVEMPEIGETKVLKLAVIQSQIFTE